MLPTQEEKLIKWGEICNAASLSTFDRAEKYAKWLIDETIKEISNENNYPDAFWESGTWWIPKDGILNINLNNK